jgi:hypothetical protein
MIPLICFVIGVILVIVGVVSWVKENKKMAIPCFIIGILFIGIGMFILNYLKV